ncbi:MAG: CBS domain-containing protein [Pirellulales bacterium]
MNVLVERLQTLRVGDAMCGRIVEIPDYKTMAEAAAILTANEVSAAPIVDDHGRCVGIISTTDFVKCVASTNGHVCREEHQCPPEWEMQATPAYDEPVTAYMTAAVQTVTVDAPLVAAARMMCAQHYHRLIVLDATHRPVGVVSTMDIVASMVNLADEVKTQEERGKRG